MKGKAKKIKNKQLEATGTVYSYYFPEVRRVIDRVVKRYPHEVFLRSVKPGLDGFHLPIINKYASVFAKGLLGIRHFKHRYVVSGASEAIFHLFVKFRIEESKTPIYAISGEYQGYGEYAKTLGTKVRRITEREAVERRLQKGIFFISNPSARDGMILSSGFLKSILRRHRVVLDATYVGLTKPFKMDIRHKNIIALFVSLSKPYGLYYYRIGFVFSRIPIASLEANKWFKNIFSLIIADKLLSAIKYCSLWRKYSVFQRNIVAHLRDKFDIPLEPSDVFILAKVSESSARVLSSALRKLLRPYRRGGIYRFCLTPYFLKYERHKTF